MSTKTTSILIATCGQLLVAPLSARAEKKLVASDAHADQDFGWCVHIGGDNAIVGAVFDSGVGNDSGAAYIFERDHGGPDNWGERIKLTPSDPVDYSQYGASVSIDVDTAIVGCPYHTELGFDAGAAYIHTRDHGGPDNWGQVTKLHPAGGGAGDVFGSGVLVHGDTAVVGAPQFDVGNGFACVFERNHGGPDNWGEVARLVAGDPVLDARFGLEAAISGDTVIVGAPHADGPVSDCGAAYIFRRDHGGPDNWGQVAKLTAGDAAYDDRFGYYVSISSDTVIVGALYDDDAGGGSGSAYIFARNHGGPDNWGQVAKLTASDAAAGDLFGERVFVNGDTAMVGAPQDDYPGCSDCGSAYVFQRNLGGPDNWGEFAKITASDGDSGDNFGISVAVAGDTALVGAHRNDGAADNAGAAYLYSLSGCFNDAQCDDGTACTYDECVGQVCQNTLRLYGDIDGNGTLNVFDIFCILDLIAGDPVGPECDWVNADIEPCDGNDTLNVFDIFAVLNMIAGDDPCCEVPEGMVRLPGGQFLMGDHHGDGDATELPVHAVYIRSLYMDIYEVTNQQYADGLNWAWSQGLLDHPTSHSGAVYGAGGGVGYCNTTISSSFSRITWDGDVFGVITGKEDRPMVNVSWYGAAAYANWRSAQEGRTLSYNLTTWECDFGADGYRLPTEAEWEYAARGGLQPECTEFPPYCRYPWGDTIDGSMANYQPSGDPFETGDMPWTTPVGYYNGSQTPPGSNMANGYGLYDMAGNVSELCNDWYDAAYYGSSPYDNPRGPLGGVYRVHRGGAWWIAASGVRCAFRFGVVPGNRNDYSIGFRLVLD